MPIKTDIIVIGAGQAGLAAAYYLKQNHREFLVLSKERRIGDTWRHRYDSLVLFTPRRYSSLPGLPLAGEPDGYPDKDELADYLEHYANHFHFPVHLKSNVLSLTKEQGAFVVRTEDTKYTANQVIVAAGPFQKPRIPELASALTDHIHQIHTSEYRNPSSLKDGPVLIVGAGNSGAQIAVELANQRKVTLSVGRRMSYLPSQLWGKSIFWWGEKLGILGVTVDRPLGKWLSTRGDPIFGNDLRKLTNNNIVDIRPRTVSFRNPNMIFADGSRITVPNVIWATGFHSDYRWIQIANVLDGSGSPVHHRGISSIEGLYFLGLPWQYRRGSALVGGVAKDAEYLVAHISR